MKKMLLKRRSVFNLLLIVNLFFLSSTAGFAATKTWNGGTGTGKNWTTGSNWSGGTAPVAGDDIIFNTAGTITFSTMPGSISYNSLTIQNGTVTLAGASACTLTLGGNIDFDLEVFGVASLTIGTNVNITLATNASARISGFFYIGSGRTFNTDGTNVTTEIFGTLESQGTVNGSAGTLLFEDGCVYRHAQNGGALPTGNWMTNSFCILAGLTTTHPSNAVQPFGNLTYNSPGMTANITMPAGISVAQDFQIYNTGTGRVLLAPGTLNVGRDVIFSTNPEALTIASTANTTLNISRDLTISGSANFDLCSGAAGVIGTVNVAGDFTNFGGVTETGAGKGVINFTGSAAQNFNQSGALVNNIDFGINNTAGVTFLASTTINGALTLTNGRLNIPAGTTLTIANGNSIGGSGFGPTKHINTQVAGATQGLIRIDNMAASTNYTIPTGNGTYYLPVTLNPPTISSFSVGVFQGITDNGLPNGVPFTATKKQGVVDAVWRVNRNSGTLGTTMTLGWPAALEGSTFSTYTASQIGISHWDGPNWGNCIGTGDNSANTDTRTGVTLFSPFSVGKTPYVLPVKFSYLNASKGNGYNTLYWKAECSSSEVSFNVERSTDGRNFSSINTITASQLRCAQPFTYVDNNSYTTTVFYRIRSIEITGQETYSTIVKLNDKQADMQLSAVLPNPVVNEARISIATSTKDAVELTVVSMEGKIVNRTTVQLQAGSSIINIDVATLQPGVYMIRGRFSNGEVSTLKFIKQ